MDHIVFRRVFRYLLNNFYTTDKLKSFLYQNISHIEEKKCLSYINTCKSVELKQFICILNIESKQNWKQLKTVRQKVSVQEYL